MKYPTIILIFLVAAISKSNDAIAQSETFDLIVYSPPKDSADKIWKKEIAKDKISYTLTNKKNNSWCQIFILKSTTSKGSIDQDFESEWQELIVKSYKPTTDPKVTSVEESKGWKMKAGSTEFKFNKTNAVAILTTASGYDRCISIVIITNSQEYATEIENLLSSVDLSKPETSVIQKNNNDNSSVIIGAWGKSNTVSQVNNRFGSYSYNKQQYLFNTDGNYDFAAKTYDEKSSETFLIKERGSYVINGNIITLTPKTSVIQAWSKKNGADNWNQLKSSQKRSLETVSYQFSIADKNLLLQTGKQTQRDGNFNNGNTYTYGPPGTFTPIELPGGEQLLPVELQKPPVKGTLIQPTTSAANSGFKFTTTNFDDGWTSTVQEDWVEVTKGSIRVLLHYPKEGTIFAADPEPLTNAAWNILVAPRYNNLKNYKTSYITSYNRPYLGMGYAIENATGKNVFIVLFRQGDSGWLEFISPDRNSFIRQFKFDPETIKWDSETDLLIPLLKMTGYNKFAVAASDLKGKWTSDFTGIQQLYNVYTGAYAGMNMNQSNEEFIFTGNAYNWKLLVVSGMVGNSKYTEVKSAGQFSAPDNWQLHFTKIENRARTYHAFWSCIKGARVLNLLPFESPGSGIYTKYGLAK